MSGIFILEIFLLPILDAILLQNQGSAFEGNQQ
jgi:hypothetical protein